MESKLDKMDSSDLMFVMNTLIVTIGIAVLILGIVFTAEFFGAHPSPTAANKQIHQIQSCVKIKNPVAASDCVSTVIGK